MEFAFLKYIAKLVNRQKKKKDLYFVIIIR